mmetsp:Transcript_2774/g.5003  ORF Transcript_2774/g.5003 Transcript_2774/m.5003 type:complete len:119 (+) Transcript_2774:127-483(+)
MRAPARPPPDSAAAKNGVVSISQSRQHRVVVVEAISIPSALRRSNTQSAKNGMAHDGISVGEMNHCIDGVSVSLRHGSRVSRGGEGAVRLSHGWTTWFFFFRPQPVIPHHAALILPTV